MITIYLKSISGDLTALEVEEKTTLDSLLHHLTVTHPIQYPANTTHLLREGGNTEETTLTDQEMVFVFFQKRVRQVLNRTEGTYFNYIEHHEYAFIPLFEKQLDGTSRWRRSDEIVFVPETVPREYIERNYERVYATSHH